MVVCTVVVGGESDASQKGETETARWRIISSIECVLVQVRCEDRGGARAVVRVNVVEEDSDDRAGRSCVYVLQGYRPAKFRSTHLPSGFLFFFSSVPVLVPTPAQPKKVSRN
jgi:hypothetical protein